MAYLLTHFWPGATEEQYRAMIAVVHPPNGLPDLRAVIEAVEALNRPIFGIVEQDMYPVAFDVPMPIAKRTRNYLLSCGSRTAVN